MLENELNIKEKLDEEIIKNNRIKLFKLEETLKNEEIILFMQMNRFNSGSYFEIRPEDRLIYFSTYKEKKEVFDYAKEFFFRDSDFVSLFNSINAVKFMLYQFLFKEYQYFLFNNLSRQSFIGKYILGYEIDNFFSRFLEQEKFLKRIDKFRRSLKKIRKNGDFRDKDEKILTLLSPYVQDNLVSTLINHMKQYFKEYKNLYSKLEVHGIQAPNKCNSRLIKTIRSHKSISELKTIKSVKSKDTKQI